MPITMSLVVLAAAVLHAAWNAMLRAGADRFWSIAVMCAAVAAVCLIAAPFVAAPAAASWPYAVASGLLHVGYNLFLVRAYRSGDLGQTYPIARGSSPVLVSLGAAIFAKEIPPPLAILGVLMVSGGIILLAFRGRGFGRETLFYALGTGCFIGAYSVTDGIGSRLSGSPVGYTTWMCLIWGVTTPLIYWAARGGRSLIRGRREVLLAAGGGIVSLIAYGAIVEAMTVGAMGPVSALRETSVVFAALMGRFFLNERLTPARLIACVVVAIGAACIGFARPA